MNQCKECGSYAINIGHYGRDGSDLDLCDTHYWKKRAKEAQALLKQWEAIDHILEGYGLQAIDFVEDFKKAMKKEKDGHAQ
jgi:hypothetical protein